MSTLLIKNARYIVSCDDTDRLYERSNLFIRDNAIEYIGPELRQADQVIDASRMVVYPGLINTHHHLYQLFSRNLPEVQRMELFPWLVTLYDVWKNRRGGGHLQPGGHGGAAQDGVHHLLRPPLCLPRPGGGSDRRPVPGG
mgnify:CR=1 FL=1